MALPSIGAGIAPMGMEVVNELGAVQLLGIPKAAVRRHPSGLAGGRQHPAGAVGLALITLFSIVMVLLVGRTAAATAEGAGQKGLQAENLRLGSFREAGPSSPRFPGAVPPLLDPWDTSAVGEPQP